MNRVIFKQDTHQYFSGKEEFISVTTLIKKYANPFDSGYWSTYKAVKDILSAKNEWQVYKMEAGGWQQVVQYWMDNPKYLDEVLERKKYYLDLWESQGHEAREKGSLRHAEKEAQIKGHLMSRSYSAGEHTEVPLGINEEGIMAGDFNSQGVYAEVLIWSEKYKVAGQVDKIIKRNKHIDIEDYKTNKELVYEGFRGSKMKAPLSKYPDCNMSHYQLQLSLYAWMLEQVGYHIGQLTIRHIPNRETDISIPVEYVPQDVEKMLNHYDKKRIFR